MKLWVLYWLLIFQSLHNDLLLIPIEFNQHFTSTFINTEKCISKASMINEVIRISTLTGSAKNMRWQNQIRSY